MDGVAGDAVVVDLDGTLWDSTPWYVALAAATGRSVSPGLTAARLLRAAGYTPRRFAAACAQGNPPLMLYPGVAGALRRLAEGGARLGVATNLPRWMVTPMLEAAELHRLFGVVVDYTATTRHKPRPDPLLLACRELGCAPSCAWYVGDASDDAAAAAAAGMAFAWASWGYGDGEPKGVARVLRRPSDMVMLVGDRP